MLTAQQGTKIFGFCFKYISIKYFENSPGTESKNKKLEQWVTRLLNKTHVSIFQPFSDIQDFFLLYLHPDPERLSDYRPLPRW